MFLWFLGHTARAGGRHGEESFTTRPLGLLCKDLFLCVVGRRTRQRSNALTCFTRSSDIHVNILLFQFYFSWVVKKTLLPHWKLQQHISCERQDKAKDVKTL